MSEIEKLYDMFVSDCVGREEDPMYYAVVVTGRFGIYFQKVYPGLGSLLVDVKEDDVMDLTPFADDINGRVFVFFDENFDLSTTKNIALGLIDHGGRIEYVYVVRNDTENESIRSLYGV